jgi:hypothetical protein
MQYTFLIYADPAQPVSPELSADYDAFTQMVVGRGAMRGGNELQRAPTATTVRVRGGRTLTTDGPYAETKEQLGGFYILDCKDLHEAIEFASQIPNAADGFIEVRPIVERDGAN